MKKKILIMLGIILASFTLVLTVYMGIRTNAYTKFLDEYAKTEQKILIRNNSMLKSYTNDEIRNLPDVASGNLEYDIVAQDNKEFIKIVDEIVKKLKESKISIRKSIERSEDTVKIGLTNADGSNFLYVYEDGMAVLHKEDKYYAYIIADYKEIETKITELTKGFVIDPYFRFPK